MKLTRPQELALVEALENYGYLVQSVDDARDDVPIDTGLIAADDGCGNLRLTDAGYFTATDIRERDQAREKSERLRKQNDELRRVLKEKAGIYVK